MMAALDTRIRSREATVTQMSTANSIFTSVGPVDALGRGGVHICID